MHDQVASQWGRKIRMTRLTFLVRNKGHFASICKQGFLKNTGTYMNKGPLISKNFSSAASNYVIS